MKEIPNNQKLRGGYYTPPEIAEFITRWGFGHGDVNKILEPSCGDGVFLGPVCEQLEQKGLSPSSESVTAIEIDKAEAKKASTRYSLNIVNDDFFNMAPSLIQAKNIDLALGNPPFIRYQNFDKEGREKAFEQMLEIGMSPNKLTNIWVPFLVLSAQSLAEDGRLGMVIPAEILQVNYAKECREFLSKYFDRITILAFRELLFQEAQQEVVIILAERKPGSTKAKIGFIELDNASDLKSLDINEVPKEKYSPLSDEDKWTKYLLSNTERALIERLKKSSDVAPTTHFFETNVGVVSGENDFFLLNQNKAKNLSLLDSVVPIVSKTDQLRGIVFSQQDFEERLSEEKKMLLFSVGESDTENLSQAQLSYIGLGEDAGVNLNYKCRIRKQWYAVPLSWKPNGFAIRQAGLFPRIVVNETDATSTDTVHKIRFKEEVDARKVAAAFLNSLTFAHSETVGRSYGGGVLTFEPSEIRKLVIPVKGWEKLDIDIVDSLVRKGDIEEVLNYTDKILLIESMGLSREDVGSLRDAWHKLSERRIRRKVKKRKSRHANE